MSSARNPSGVSAVQWCSTMSRLVVTLVILAVLLFVPAGRITWTRGWIFLLVFTLLMAASIVYFTHANPEMFAVRSRVHPDTKQWDKIVMCLLFVAILAIPPVAGLDDGRFHWSSMSCWVVALGYLCSSQAGLVLHGRRQSTDSSNRACAFRLSVDIT